MRIAIVTLLQVAYAMLTQEASDAQIRKDTAEVSRLLTVQAALHGVIAALTAVNDAEVDAAMEKVTQRLEERRVRITER
jgi:hypothetical protein